jgi:hypothetical protein
MWQSASVLVPELVLEFPLVSELAAELEKVMD